MLLILDALEVSKQTKWEVKQCLTPQRPAPFHTWRSSESRVIPPTSGMKGQQHELISNRRPKDGFWPHVSGKCWITLHMAYIYIYIHIYIYSYIFIYILTIYLAFYLASSLTFYLASILAFYLASSLTFYLASILAFYLASSLTFYLASILAFYLASSLTFYLALSLFGPRPSPAHSVWSSRYEVRQRAGIEVYEKRGGRWGKNMLSYKDAARNTQKIPMTRFYLWANCGFSLQW